MSSKSSDDDNEGELVFAGSVSWSMVGRSAPTSAWDGVPGENILYGFHRLAPFVDQNIRIKKVICGPHANHTIAVDSAGNGFIWGRNEDGQLGLGDLTNRYNPTRFLEHKHIKAGACGAGHTLVITTLGELLVSGRNDCGQLGTGNTFAKTSFTDAGLPNLVTVAAGREFSVGADVNGQTYSWGSPMYGQLGNGGEHKSLEKAGKWTYQLTKRPTLIEALAGVMVVEVSCGANHTVARDHRGHVFTWGFGGYGRLGHSDNKDQHLPKDVEHFSKPPRVYPDSVPAFMRSSAPPLRATSVTAGGSCCYAIGNDEYLYFWGITKKAGEATMRPVAFEQTSGWRCIDVAASVSSSILSASEPYEDSDSLITWGPSPTYGELGYGDGEAKSSTVPREVQSLKGARPLQVAMGQGHSVAIISTEGKGRALLDKLPVFQVEELGAGADPGGDDSESAAASGKRKRSGSDGAGKKKNNNKKKKKKKPNNSDDAGKGKGKKKKKKKKKKKPAGASSD